MTKEIAKQQAADLTPMQLMEQAVAKGVDPDALGKLVALQDQHQAKLARKAWNNAVSWFRAKCPPIKKSKGVPDKHGRIKYSYSPLDQIQQVIDPFLDEFQLSVMFDTVRLDGVDYAVCRITHVDGHYEETRHPIDLPDIPHATASQKRGGGVTFARRYALIGALNLPIVGEDQNTEPPTPITESQAADLRALIDEVDIPLEKVLGFGTVDRIEDFPAAKYARTCKRLRNRAQQK